MKIYLDAITEELITNDGIHLKARPKYSELYRQQHLANGTLTINSQHNYDLLKEFVCRDLHWEKAFKENGDSYANFAELWDALTPFFSV